MTLEAKKLLLSCVDGDPVPEFNQPKSDSEYRTSVRLQLFTRKGGKEKGGYISLSNGPVSKRIDFKKSKEHYLQGPFGLGNKKSESDINIPFWRMEKSWGTLYSKKIKSQEPKIFPEEYMVKNNFAQVVKCLLIALCGTNQNDESFNKALRKHFPRLIPPYIPLNYTLAIKQTYDRLKEKPET